MSTNDTCDDTPEEPNTNTPELLDPDNRRMGHHGRMDVQVEIPPEIAVTVAARLGVEAVCKDTRELPAERADVWALDLIELRPTFVVLGPEGHEVPLADYLHERGVPIKPSEDTQSTTE